jgi:hypothetical protein
MRLRRFLLLLVLLPAAAWAANTQVSSEKPIINFSLPAFTPDGFRSWLVRGSEGRYLPKQNQIEVRELNLSIFSGLADNRVDTIIVSPVAIVTPAASVVSGPTTIRVINDQFEATGSDWRYGHKDRKITIAKHVRITFRAEFTDLLK